MASKENFVQEEKRKTQGNQCKIYVLDLNMLHSSVLNTLYIYIFLRGTYKRVAATPPSSPTSIYQILSLSYIGSVVGVD